VLSWLVFRKRERRRLADDAAESGAAA
jgi:hypothetical protein